MANEIMIFGKKVDDGGVVGLFSREHPDHKLDEQQLDRFEYFCVLHQTRLAELLDDYPRLIVRWEDDDEEATVYLIPAGTVLISQPRSAVPSVTMRFTSVRAAESQMSQERPKTFTRMYLEQPEIAEWAKNTEPMSPEEQEEEMRAYQRHREKLRRSAAGTLPSPGSPSLAEDRPKRRAAAMSIKAAGAKGEGQ